MKNQFSVVIVAGDPSITFRFRSWLAEARGITLTGEGDTEAEGLVLARERGPDVLLLDVGLWAAAAGREPLATRYSHCRVLLLYRFGEEPEILAALRTGAAGCLQLETLKRETLLDALYAVARGEAVLPPVMAGLILDEISGRPGDVSEPDCPGNLSVSERTHDGA